MPRLMSVAFTEDAVRARIKTVTRRKGWTFLKPGDRLTLCRKVMGRQGAPLVRVAEVQVVAVTREPLSAITPAEVALEGFPGMTPAEFIRRFFTDAQGIPADAEVTRVEWRYLECTCPSGDGSLRWPCPVHPPTIHELLMAKAGEAYGLAFDVQSDIDALPTVHKFGSEA